jgi:hypothetical protein
MSNSHDNSAALLRCAAAIHCACKLGKKGKFNTTRQAKLLHIRHVVLSQGCPGTLLLLLLCMLCVGCCSNMTPPDTQRRLRCKLMLLQLAVNAWPFHAHPAAAAAAAALTGITNAPCRSTTVLPAGAAAAAAASSAPAALQLPAAAAAPAAAGLLLLAGCVQLLLLGVPARCVISPVAASTDMLLAQGTCMCRQPMRLNAISITWHKNENNVYNK